MVLSTGGHVDAVLDATEFGVIAELYCDSPTSTEIVGLSVEVQQAPATS